MNKLKKLLISAMVMVVTVTSTSVNAVAKIEESGLKPGEVTQNKTAEWNDYAKGIAEISFDVVGKSVEEPVDVVIIYDNSGSMQLSEKTYGDYLTSRWYYASQAAKTFSDSLLQNDKNNVAFVPFSDVLIDGNSLHSNPSDFFETHDFIYDKDGNPDIQRMISFATLYEGYITGKTGMTEEEFYKYCEDGLKLTKEDVDRIIKPDSPVNNTKNAVVPFTKERAKINNAIESLYPSHAGQTNYEIALRKAQELFSSSSNNKVIVMISDGKPNKGGDSIALAKQLKDSGVTIYTCGTGISDSDAATLKSIASIENNDPFYSSSKPSDLSKTLEKIRKEIGIAAEQAVITDEINSEYFEYFVDETHYPTVNGVKISNEEIIVSENKDAITWNVGNIREEKKTLKFYVKVKDSLLNKDLLDKDQSFLNKAGDYLTNNGANLTYKEANSDNIITTGHEMESPKLSVSTASMKQIYYLSDASGKYIEENGEKIVLWEDNSNNKALNVEYTVAPKASIEIDGVKYFVLKEDNKETKKTFTNSDINALFEYRYVKQLTVTFDTNELGQFDDNSVIKDAKVNHETMTVDALPHVNANNGKNFMGWNTHKDGSGETFDASYIIKNNMTVYAQYGNHPLNVVFQDENKNVYKKQIVDYGNDATAPTTPNKEGYTFVGWDKDFTNVKTDLIVTSKFEANKYTVTFDGNGATSGTMRDQEFTYDVAQKLNKNVYEREDHAFIGWLYNGEIYTDEAEVKNLIAEANGNITFVAQWREDNKYTVIFQDDTGNLLQESSVYEGEDAKAPTAPHKEGYTFVGWDKDFTNIRGDLVVTAIYEANVVVIIPPTIIPGQPILPTDTPTAPGIPPVVTAPGLVNTPVTPVQPEIPVQGEQTVTPPVANEEIIEDQEVPLGTIGGSWALVNLICTIVVTILGIFLLLAKHKKEEDEDSTVTYKRRRWAKVATIAVAIVTIIAFIITEDITLPMILTDKWTVGMLILTLLQIVVVYVGRKWKEDKEQEQKLTA